MGTFRLSACGILLGVLTVASPVGAWEIANTNSNSMIDLIGQSFLPTTQDDGDDFFLPRNSHGVAYLESLSFVLASGEAYPNEVFIYSEQPLVIDGVVSGDNALGSAFGGFGGYFFSTPVAVPYNQTLYLVFPNCLSTRTQIVSYSGGSGLTPQGGCPGSGGTQTLSNSFFDLEFSARFLNPLAPLAADYRLDQGNFGSFLQQAPGMIDLGTNSFIQDTVLGQPRSVLEVLSGTGVELDLASILSQQSYSIVLLIRVDDVDGARRLLDLSLLSQDDGLYVSDQSLDFRGAGITPSQPLISPDTYLQIALNRDEPSEFRAGSARSVVGNQDALSFNDDNGVALPSGGSAIILRDDMNENTGGALARVRVFDGAMPTSQLKVLEPFPPETTDIYEPDNVYFDSDVGISSGNFSSFRTFHSSDDADWVFVGEDCIAGNYYSSQGGLQLYSDDPRFQPIVEVYGESLLLDPNAAPQATYGQCGTEQQLYFRPPVGHVKIRNCETVDLSSGPVAYTVVPLLFDFTVCGPISTIRGTVIDTATGNPVGGQFILGNGSSTTVSNPATGDYSLAVTAGVMDLQVVSPLWQGDSVELVTQPLENYTGIDLLVSRSQPDAQDDSFITDEDVAFTGDVSANDLLSGDGANNFSLVAQAVLGSVALSNNGEFTYTPNANANDADTFTYQITDQSGDTDTATVAIEISPINDAPNAASDSRSVNQDSAATVIDVLANDIDPDGDTLTVSAATQPAQGTVEIASDGLSLSYQPDAGFCAGSSSPDVFTYTVSDGLANDSGDVSIVVICVGELVFRNGFEN